jgi:hypothetical protein
MMETSVSEVRQKFLKSIECREIADNAEDVLWAKMFSLLAKNDSFEVSGLRIGSNVGRLLNSIQSGKLQVNSEDGSFSVKFTPSK